jgi:GNAT superfamily N-acetyltransferase
MTAIATLRELDMAHLSGADLDAANFVRANMAALLPETPCMLRHFRSGAGYVAGVRDPILSRARVVLAMHPTLDGQILGFAAHEGDVLHVVYVKARWRGLGVAKLLLDVIPDVATYTHLTKQIDPARLPATWTHDPMRALRPNEAA